MLPGVKEIRVHTGEVQSSIRCVYKYLCGRVNDNLVHLQGEVDSHLYVRLEMAGSVGEALHLTSEQIGACQECDGTCD